MNVWDPPGEDDLGDLDETGTLLYRLFGARGMGLLDFLKRRRGASIECYGGDGKPVSLNDVVSDSGPGSTWMHGVDVKHGKIVIFKSTRCVIPPAQEAGETGEGWGFFLAPAAVDGARRRVVGVWCFCPDCHEPAVLDKHAVWANGTVVPSYVCPDKKCGYHEFVSFQGWPGLLLSTEGFEWQDTYVSVPGVHRVRVLSPQDAPGGGAPQGQLSPSM